MGVGGRREKWGDGVEEGEESKVAIKVGGGQCRPGRLCLTSVRGKREGGGSGRVVVSSAEDF